MSDLRLTALLSDTDIGTLLLKHLTIQEGGLVSGTCKTAYTVVRDAENTPDRWTPMWSLDRVLKRLERFRQPFFADGGLQFKETTALARLLIEDMLPQMTIELDFQVTTARMFPEFASIGVLGCTGLFVRRRRRWMNQIHHCVNFGALSGEHMMRAARMAAPGSYISDLLNDLGLHYAYQHNPWAGIALPPLLLPLAEVHVPSWSI